MKRSWHNHEWNLNDTICVKGARWINEDEIKKIDFPNE